MSRTLKHDIETYTLLIMIALSGVIAIVQFTPKVRDPTKVLVNQIGYLPIDNGKRVLLQIDYLPEGYQSGFTVEVQNISANNEGVFNATAVYRGDLWGHYYFEANISELREPGTYRAMIRINNDKEFYSYPFKIASDVYDEAMQYAYLFYYYQRSGCEVLELIPGYPGHGACHLDDANPEWEQHNPNAWRNLTGGWFDAGDFNKYNGYTLDSIYSLTQVYEQNKAFFEQPNRTSLYPNSSYTTHYNYIPDVLEEAIWGADFIVKCTNENGSLINRVGSNDFHGWYGYTGRPEYESDNDPSTPSDNRKYLEIAGYPIIGTVALLKLSRILTEKGWFSEKATAYQQAALKQIQYYVKPTDIHYMTLLLYLEQYLQSSNITYLEKANFVAEGLLNSSRIEFPGFGHCGVDFDIYALGEWARINGSVEAQNKINQAYSRRWTNFWQPLSSDTNNIFKLLKGNHSQHGIFYFWSNRFPGQGDWNVGQNSYYMQAAFATFQAYKFTNESKYLDFGLRQLDWIFGLNPFALCMIEGLGSNNPPTYHHRLESIPGNIRGAVPGIICNGIVRTPAKTREITADEPWFDFREYPLEKGGADYQSNEPWLPHNAFGLMALSQLKTAL